MREKRWGEEAGSATRVLSGATVQAPRGHSTGFDIPRGRPTRLSSLLSLALTLCLAGCGDQVRLPTPHEMAAFEQAGAITPVIDLDRIEKAKLKTGPYRVVAGDVLEFTMPTLLQAVTAAEVQAAQTRSQGVNPYLARVRDNGAIALPAVGSMTVAGLSLAQIEERVTDAYKSHIVLHPSVFVRIAEYKTEKVYISGAVENPGVYALHSDQMTLSSLLTEAGGISDVGAAVVRVIRSELPPDAGDFLAGAREVAVSDANDRSGASPLLTSSAPAVLQGASSTPGSVVKRTGPKPILLPVVSTNIPYRDIALDEGDTVVVEPVQMPLFSVLGLVAKPGNFPYPPGTQYNLTQAIAFAGGLDTVARPYYATIYRLNQDGSIARVPFRLLKNDKFTDALGVPIRPGDIVAVEHTPRTRFNTAVRDLFRFNAGLYITGNDLWDNN